MNNVTVHFDCRAHPQPFRAFSPSFHSAAFGRFEPYQFVGQYNEAMVNNATHIPQDLIDTIKTADHVVIFTGTGISVESGIPTFRGSLAA